MIHSQALRFGLPLLLLTSFATAQFGPGRPGGPGGGQPTPSFSVTTASDFGAYASLASATAYDADASGTAVARALDEIASVGTPPGPIARAVSSVSLTRTREGAGVSILERGTLQNADPTFGGSIGTSADAPGTAAPTQGAHRIRIAYPAITSDAIVTIHWRGNASTGASASCAVDVDGDGTADFTGSANGSRVTRLLQLTANANGIAIDVSTSANAALAADGSENYAAEVTVLVMPGTLPTSCTFTNFGTNCGADLGGTVGSTGLALSLDVTNAPADTVGFFVAGPQDPTPTPLPSGVCNLLVDRSRFFHMMIRTDATGAVSVPIPTPRSAFTISFQAILVTTDPVTNARVMVASNGTELVCQ